MNRCVCFPIFALSFEIKAFGNEGRADGGDDPEQGEIERLAQRNLFVDADNDAFVREHSFGDPLIRLAARIGVQLTERVEVERDRQALLDLARTRVGSLVDGECVEPDSDRRALVRPERVFERADAAQVRPVKFDAVCEDLHVVLDLVRRCLARPEEDELALDQEDYRGDV